MVTPHVQYHQLTKAANEIFFLDIEKLHALTFA